MKPVLISFFFTRDDGTVSDFWYVHENGQCSGDVPAGLCIGEVSRSIGELRYWEQNLPSSYIAIAKAHCELVRRWSRLCEWVVRKSKLSREWREIDRVERVPRKKSGDGGIVPK